MEETARSKAKQLMSKYKANCSALERKKQALEDIRNNGSLHVQQYKEAPGRSSAEYVDSFPKWLERAEKLEEDIFKLGLDIQPISDMIRDMEQENSELLIPWRLRYERKLSTALAEKEALSRFGKPKSTFWDMNYRLVDKAMEYLGVNP